MVARAQQLLLGLGYDVGTADGVIGGNTDEAIRKFQGWEGLPRNGKVSAELIGRLELAEQTKALMAGSMPLTDDFQPHADMCRRGVHAWYRSRTTKLSVDGVSQSIEQLVAEITIWFSYPGEKLERVRGTAVCKYTRYRGEMPEQPLVVDIVSGDLTEQLSDREIACFSEGQPC
jgi:hypothetical protein